MYILSVIPLTKIPRPAPQILDYFSSKTVASGGVVEVSIGKRKILAIVLSQSSVSKEKQYVKRSSFTLKPVEKVLSTEEIVPKEYLSLFIWTSNYYYTSLGLIAKSLLPPVFSRPTKKFITEIEQKKAGPGNTFRGTTPRIALQKNKPILYWNRHNEQDKIFFYKKQIQQVIKKNGSILFLVPEIYKIEYFQKKISYLKKATVMHSRLTAKTQYDIWKKSIKGETKIIIGTRSSLSVPLSNLGLIIVDEEENVSYKSFDQQPYTNTKDMAIQLGKLRDAKVILGSSLPSIESFWKAKKREYELKIPMTKSQISNTPEIKIVDMKKELKSGNYSIFSRELQEKLLKTIKDKKQAILFINRKGLSTGLLCRDCGHIIKCPNCDVAMVFHQSEYGVGNTKYSLICHHCGQKKIPPTVCPECQSYKIKWIGTGTQRVEQEINELFKKNNISEELYNVARLDKDIAPIWEEQELILKNFSEKKCNILIGTQMILRTTLLPKVNLVSAITIDPMLSIPDFRMNENVYRIIDKLQTLSLSTMILQTYIVDNDVHNDINKNFKIFVKKELENRKELSFPPFSQIIKLSYAHPDPQNAEKEANLLKNKLETQLSSLKFESSNFSILGPAPAFISRVKNRYIWQIMLKSKIKEIELRNKLLRIIPSSWKIDIDSVDIY